MNWQMVAALAAWTAIVGALLYLVVRLTIKDSVRDGIDAALTRVDAEYMRSGGTKVTGAELERRLEALEKQRRHTTA